MSSSANDSLAFPAAVFRWGGVLPSDDEIGADASEKYSGDYGEQWAFQATKPVAESVMEAISHVKCSQVIGPLYFGEQAWRFDLNIGKRQYSVAVEWVKGENWFCVQPMVRLGCILGLFANRPSGPILTPACEAIQTALENHSQVSHLTWVEEKDTWG